MQPQQSQAEHYEREGETVVQARLPAQGVPDGVPVGGAPHLHLRGQHRIGRSQHGPEQHRCAQWQLKQRRADQGYCGDRQHHAHGGEAYRQRPKVGGQGGAPLQPHREERDDDGNLAQVLQDLGLSYGVPREQSQSAGAQQHPDAQVDDRCEDGQEPQQHRG
jgi:hypothetical protein